MTTQLTFRFIFLSTLILAGSFGRTSWAYLPPAHFIIKHWLAKHFPGVKTIQIKSTVTALANDQPTPVHFKEVLIYRVDNQMIQSVLKDDSDQILYSTQKKGAELPFLIHLLFSTHAKGLIELVQAKGIPIKSEKEWMAFSTLEERLNSEPLSLKRWDPGKTFAWVMSASKAIAQTSRQPAKPLAKTPNDFEPQIWFEKDTFFPLRVMAFGETKKAFFDIQLQFYRYFGKFYYPSLIKIKSQAPPPEGLERTCLIERNELLINPEKLELLPHPFFTQDTKSDLPPNLKDLIEMYIDAIR